WFCGIFGGAAALSASSSRQREAERPAIDSPKLAKGCSHGIVRKGLGVLRSESCPVRYRLFGRPVQVWRGRGTESGMETLMRVACRAWSTKWIVVGCLVLALPMGIAQQKPSTSTTNPNETRRVLVDKAHALESRGRPDMAIQLWQQILLSEPGNTEALAGMARDYKLIGSADKSAEALDRLRRVNPNDPNIAKIAQLTSTTAQSDKLRQA